MAKVEHLTSGSDRIVLAVMVAATPERVFRALTDPADLQRWFFPESHTDPRPGGRYKFVWHSQNAQSNHVREGEFLEVVPFTRVSYTWDARHIRPEVEMGGRPLLTTVVFDLEEVAGGTRVVLTHSGWGDDPEWREMFTFHDEGWEFFIGNLADVYGGAPDRRVEIMEMQA